MRVTVFGRTHQPGISALMMGATACSDVRASLVRPVACAPTDALPEAEAVIVFGQRGAAALLTARYTAADVPVYVMDLPRLRCPDAPERVGLYAGTLHHLPMRIGNVAHAYAALKRPAKGRYVLLCGQLPNDMAHGLDARTLTMALRDAALLCTAQFNAPIVYRPHPLDERDVPHEIASVVSRVDAPRDTALMDAMQDAIVVVSYNSTVGWDAVAAGVPVAYVAPSAAHVSWGEYGVPLGRALYVVPATQRRLALMRAASCEWTMPQLASGEALACTLGLFTHPLASLVERAYVSQEVAASCR